MCFRIVYHLFFNYKTLIYYLLKIKANCFVIKGQQNCQVRSILYHHPIHRIKKLHTVWRCFSIYRLWYVKCIDKWSVQITCPPTRVCIIPVWKLDTADKIRMADIMPHIKYEQLCVQAYLHIYICYIIETKHFTEHLL